MGYDMYWEAIADDEAPGPESKEPESYFRLNIWGMARARSVMSRMGMLDVFALPRFAEPSEFGLEEEPPLFDDDGVEIEYPEGSAEARWIEAELRTRTIESAGVMPGYKLSSMDGWLVSPGEIERSLATYRGFCAASGIDSKSFIPRSAVDYLDLDEKDLDWWPDWIRWLETARDHGGFRVW
jgi:hypothetical protein